MTVCSMIPLPKILYIHRVGQNHIYTVYIRYFWLGNHQIYGVYIRIYTVLANPIYTLSICGSGQPFGRIYIKPEGSLSKMHEHRPRYHKNNGFAATTMPWKLRFRHNHDAMEHNAMEQRFCCNHNAKEHDTTEHDTMEHDTMETTVSLQPRCHRTR